MRKVAWSGDQKSGHGGAKRRAAAAVGASTENDTEADDGRDPEAHTRTSAPNDAGEHAGKRSDKQGTQSTRDYGQQRWSAR